MKAIFYSLLFLLSLTAEAQDIIEQNLIKHQEVNGIGTDTLLFPRAVLKSNKIKKYIKSSYYFNSNGRIRRKKQEIETSEFTTDGFLESYSRRPLTFRAKRNLSSFSLRIKYDKDNHATELHLYNRYAFNKNRSIESIHTKRQLTDSGTLIQTIISQRGDTIVYPYTFLVKEKSRSQKVYCYEKDDGYDRVTTDTATIFYPFSKGENSDTAIDAICSCTYNHDKSIEHCNCVGKPIFNIGLILPLKCTRWFHKDNHHLMKQQIEQNEIYYNEGGYVIELATLVYDRDKDTLIPVTRYKVQYERPGLPFSKLYFKRVERDGFYYIIPYKLSKYTYEFYTE